MKLQNKYRKMGMFDYDTLTVKFGGELSKPENIFTATAIKVPSYTIVSYEREDAGNGWYGRNKERVERNYNNTYLIFKESECIGWMIGYDKCQNIKSELHPLEIAHEQVLKYLKSIN